MNNQSIKILDQKTKLSMYDKMQSLALSWGTYETPVFYNTVNGVNQIPNKKAIVRQDTNQCLAVMGTGFQSVSNDMKFDFLSHFEKNGDIEIVSGGYIKNGAKVWIQAKLGKVYSVNGDDIESYLTIIDSYDGSTALKIKIVPVRIKCNNMLSGIIKGFRQSELSLRHNSVIHSKFDDFKKILTVADLNFQKAVDAFKLLDSVKIIDAEQTLNKMHNDGLINKREFDHVGDNYYTNRFSQDLNDTAYALYNAFTGYFTHQTTSKSAVSSNLVGSLAVRNERILNELMKLAV